MNKLVAGFLRLLLAFICVTAVMCRPKSSRPRSGSATVVSLRNFDRRERFERPCADQGHKFDELSGYFRCYVQSADLCRKACFKRGCFLWLQGGTVINPFSKARRDYHVCSCIPFAGCKYEEYPRRRGWADRF